MYESLAWTASTTYGADGEVRQSVIDHVDITYLLLGLDLCIGVNVGSMRKRPGRRVDRGILSY